MDANCKPTHVLPRQQRNAAPLTWLVVERITEVHEELRRRSARMQVVAAALEEQYKREMREWVQREVLFQLRRVTAIKVADKAMDEERTARILQPRRPTDDIDHALHCINEEIRRCIAQRKTVQVL
eukprot:m.346606 g.346606  ORF g.346606 m.346606 type:complete len:126 (+) comp29613_c0_seq1:191-568(+)